MGLSDPGLSTALEQLEADLASASPDELLELLREVRGVLVEVDEFQRQVYALRTRAFVALRKAGREHKELAAAAGVTKGAVIQQVTRAMRAEGGEVG